MGVSRVLVNAGARLALQTLSRRTARPFSPFRIFPGVFLLPHSPHSSSLLISLFCHRSQAPRAKERLRPAARRSSASLSRLYRFWFLPLCGHPPRKQTLALGSRLTLAPSGWCALRDSGHQKEGSYDVRQFSEASWVRRQRRGSENHEDAA